MLWEHEDKNMKPDQPEKTTAFDNIKQRQKQ